MISSENGLLVVTVLLNVRGRDVGSFVDEARQVIARTVQFLKALCRMERPVRERDPGPPAAADRHPDRLLVIYSFST